MVATLTIALLLHADETLWAVPAVEKSWGSNGTQHLYGYVNRAGKMVIAPAWDNAGPFRDGYATVSNRVWFYGSISGGPLEEPPQQLIDRTGKVVASHRTIGQMSDGRVSFCDEKCGWLEPKTGKTGELKREGLATLSEGLAAFFVKGKWGYADGDGKVVLEPKWIFADAFNGGVARVGLAADAWGLVDRSGVMVLPAEYRDVQNTSDAWVVVRDKKDLEYRYLDKHAKPVSLTTHYAYAGAFVGDAAVAMSRREDGTVDYGYIRRDGTWIAKLHSPGSFFPAEAMTGFHDGLAVVAEYRGEGWVYWYAGADGKKKLGRDFVQATAFVEGLAQVQFWKGQRLRVALIDTKGAVVWEGPQKAAPE